MRSKNNIGLKSNEELSMRALLLALLFIAMYLFATYTCYLVNTREDSRVLFADKTRTYLIDGSFDANDTLFVGSDWILVPNVTSDDIEQGYLTFQNYRNIPYASEVTIDERNGWRDLGEEAQWHNTDTAPELRDYPNGIHYDNCGVYLARFKTPLSAPTLNLNIPEINGNAEVYCNGIHIGSLGDSASRSGLSMTSSYKSIAVPVSDKGVSEIMIAVRTDSLIRRAGICSIPAISGSIIDAEYNSASSVWYAFQSTLVILIVIGVVVVSRTFASKWKLLTILMLLTTYTFYLANDRKLINVDSLGRIVVKFALSIALSMLFYGFVSSLFDKSDTEKTPKFFKHDYKIVIGIGLALVFIGWANKELITSIYPSLVSLLFSILVSVACITKIIIYYLNDKNGAVALISSVAYLFCSLDMINGVAGIYDIPLYTVFFAMSVLAIEIYFFLRYVKQFRELNDTTEHLQYLVREKTLHISEINKDLYNTNKRLMENEEARKNVLSNVSHDLRTPITAIRGYAELLRSAGKNMTDDQKNNYLGNIVKRSEQMERIVSDIVELTRMESNAGSEFNFTEISIAELLDELVMMYEGDLNGTEKSISLELPDGDDFLIINADPKKISRVFENLINNAINYTYEQAQIKVKAYRTGEEEHPDSQRIHVIISDNGIGIPKEEINKIFDRFYRAKNSGQNIKGTGLGLSIVKTILDHHDAEISVESSLGSGTTFHIVFKAAS